MVAVFAFWSADVVYGQYDDYNYDNYDYNSDPNGSNPDSLNDTSGYDYNYEGGSGSFGYDFGNSSSSSSTPTKKKIERKPYVRFVPPYDSTRELIIYQAIIEVVDNEGYEVEIDTIYGRAQKWLEAEFGKDLKKVTQSNAMNDNSSETEYKIRVKGTFPCIIKPNEFVEIQDGDVQYDMEIRVRDGRYRYAVKNLVHIAPPRPGEKEGEKTYFEFLMKAKDDAQGNDKILIAADQHITAMMNGLKKACETAPIPEDDDWWSITTNRDRNDKWPYDKNQLA